MAGNRRMNSPAMVVNTRPVKYAVSSAAFSFIWIVARDQSLARPVVRLSQSARVKGTYLSPLPPPATQ